MKERYYYEELRNIADNSPLEPGDTIAHSTANECGRRGWALRDNKSRWCPTNAGLVALLIYEAQQGGEGEG